MEFFFFGVVCVYWYFFVGMIGICLVVVRLCVKNFDDGFVGVFVIVSLCSGFNIFDFFWCKF